MSEVEQVNSAEARTPTGELKGDLSVTPTTPPTTTPPAIEAKAPEAPSPETKSTTDSKSLLNQEESKPPAEAVPEKYEAFKVPEGFTLDETASKEVNEMFKDLKLTQSQGQKLVDYYAKQMQQASQAPYEHWKKMQTDWEAEIKADPEIGGRLQEVRQTIGRALDGLGDPKLTQAFRDAMDLTGSGNNPAFVRAFFKLAKQVTEGGGVAAGGPSKFGQIAPGSSERPTAAKSIYPNLA
jgi:hypothetical protein